MIKAKTKSGFSFTISDEAANDWEIVEYLTTMEDGDVTAVVRILRKMLGDEQYKKLKEHIRDENGHVAVTSMVEALTEILGASSKTKNS